LIHLVTRIENSQKQSEENAKKIASQSANALMLEMAQGLAHEVNNPLAILALNAQLQLKKSTHTNTAPEIDYKSLEKMQTAIKRCKSVVRGLEVFSQEEQTLSIDQFTTPQDVQAKLEALFSPQFESQGIALQFENLCHAELQIPSVAVTILAALTTNALDAHLDSNESAWVKIQFNADQNHAYWKVIDSGRGIPAVIVPHLFTPFVSTKATRQARGMGLAISRQYAHQAGGDLRYELKTAHTTFELILPFKTIQQSNESSTPSAAAA
jgi:signal transduction histidine kinase